MKTGSTNSQLTTDRNRLAYRVYFDDTCTFCIGAMRWGRRLDVFGNLRFIPLSAVADSDEPVSKLSSEDLFIDIHGTDAKGGIDRGFPVYRSALSAMIWTRPIAWLLWLPGIAHLGRWIYRRVARNRHACRTPERACETGNR
jgi:predicted DCC family thiol-disulfide oxidoreductase YuxK